MHAPVRAVAIMVGAALALAGCAEKPVGTAQADGYLVGAYYYCWYPKNFSQGTLRRQLDPRQRPAQGFYDSADPAVAERHIAWAAPNGIDFFAATWWPSRPEQNAALTNGLLRARNLGDIRFCVFYETWALGFDKDLGATVIDRAKRERFVADFAAFADGLFRHPSYLTVGGRPVVILYLTRTLAGDFSGMIREARAEVAKRGLDVFLIGDEVFWDATPAKRRGRPHPLVEEPQRDRVRLFDAITSYNMYEGARTNHAGYGAESAFFGEVAARYTEYRDVAPERVMFVPGVIPGYNDRGVRHRAGHYAIPRQWTAGAPEGSFLREAFARLGLPFADPRLNMILVTSWNEWNEDTAIEPMQPSPTTTRDQTKAGDYFTQGYAYAGHTTEYLEAVRDAVVAVSGAVIDETGAPVPGVLVEARVSGEIVARVTARSDGTYRISRLRVSPGLVVLHAGAAPVSVDVAPDRCVTGVVLRVAAPRR